MKTCPYALHDLLPHAPPMVLLDEVLGWDNGQAMTAVTMRNDSPFFTVDKGVRAYVGLEYMAQTCGVYAGIETLNAGLPVQPGYLLGTRNFHAAADWFLPGARLVIDVKEIFRQEKMAAFDCRIMLGEQLVASAQLNLYQADENLLEVDSNG